jgi:hypothetical protein
MHECNVSIRGGRVGYPSVACRNETTTCEFDHFHTVRICESEPVRQLLPIKTHVLFRGVERSVKR